MASDSDTAPGEFPLHRSFAHVWSDAATNPETFLPPAGLTG